MIEKKITPKVPHYYGDIVRMLFLAIAIIMFIGLPSLVNYISPPTIISIVAMLILGLLAGLTNPRFKIDALLNTLTSAVGFIIFGMYAVLTYNQYGVTNWFFMYNFLIGFIFLFAVYFSTKTLRGSLWRNDNAINQQIK